MNKEIEMRPNRIAAIVTLIAMSALLALSVMFDNPKTANATVIMITDARQYTGLSTDTKPALTDAQAGAIFYETNTSLAYRWNGSAWATATISAAGDTTVVFAPGNTDAIYSRGTSIAGFLFSIASINTSVTMILQGRVGDSEWSAVDVDSTVYTVNDNEGLLSSNSAAFDSLRLRFHSEAGGTAAEITAVSTLGGVE